MQRDRNSARHRHHQRLRPRAFGSTLLVLVLSACATSPPPSPQEIRSEALGDMPLDQAWRAASASSQELVQDNWLRSFNDPALDLLVREALANNPDLRVAAARVEQAGQYLVLAQSALRPSIGLFGTGGTKTGSGGDATSALQAIVLAVSWELDLWGRLRYARNASGEDFASARADLEFARQSLAASTAKAWFASTQLSLHAQIAAETAQSANQLYALAQDREKVGVGIDAETAVARANARAAESTRTQVELARDQSLRALELLVGRYPAAELKARADLLALPASVATGIPLQMLERRPDIVAAERRVAAAFNRVGEAKAARLPLISLSLNGGAYASEILELKEDYDNPSGGLGGRLLAPIYQGGGLTAKVELRTLEQKEAVADYARIALRAIGEVENALAASSSLATQAELLSESLAEQARALELTETRFRVGRADRRAVEQQRLNLQAARIALLSVRSDELVERVNLHLALGGSFETPGT